MSETRVTAEAAAFVERVTYADIPDEALRIGRRCILDAAGLYISGAAEPSIGILIADAKDQGGRPDALLIGAGTAKAPAAVAARVLATSGHAQDWDDTQVSQDPAHVYGLLTHPTIPPLTAALVMAQRLGGVDGRGFMTAFLAGFEVECKISEWLLPAHYRKGHHSSGTVGTFGACAAAAKLLGLTGERLLHAFGIAASLAAGIRCNFGTMTKPLHVGRAAENGVTAALLAARGYTADPAALDGRWGFAAVLAGGFTAEKVAQGFGRTWTIIDPGVSIKPYPSGILTHQFMDAMLALVTRHDVRPEQIERIRFAAGKNILEPIRYPIAVNELQAKFSVAALLAMIALKRRATHHEFTDAFVASPAMQALQRKVECVNDPAIDAQGYDLIRSRIDVTLSDGRVLSQEGDVRYRGGPMNPMSDADLEDKFHGCAEGAFDAAGRAAIIAAIRAIDGSRNAAELARLMTFERG
jgi:2-methylcitrate dehydratase PrpD